jgi:23S rRNA-/tRNA-specific pseudouridylate synthase
METSGAMVLAFTEQAHKELNRAFENRLVQKK